MLCKNNPFASVEEAEIVAFVGDFDNEYNILKKFELKGQCFITSKYITTLVPEQVQIGVLPDIKRDGFCFTDGVGLISKQMA